MPKSQMKVSYKDMGLEKLVKGSKEKYTTKVGILGGGISEDGKTTMAEIGLYNEFGTISAKTGKQKIPARSFLRFPLEFKRKQVVKDILKVKEKIQSAMAEGDFKKLFEIMGVSATNQIDKAFETGGFGQWKANAQVTINKKGSSSPLIDTGELRKTITSEVKKLS